MASRGRRSRRILLLGLEESLARELGAALGGAGRLVRRPAAPDALACVRVIDRAKADLVFCPPQEQDLKPVLTATGQRSPAVPVVVVTRHPEVSEWLDAMDAGAADYCAAPFEPKQVRWILESNLH